MQVQSHLGTLHGRKEHLFSKVRFTAVPNAENSVTFLDNIIDLKCILFGYAGNFLFYFTPHRIMNDVPVLGAIYLKSKHNA